ncbi:hypothetical protein GE21DRAFT_1307979 [Neurospora crassa]|nr:hypothetical protein GE21DRAFT_1307979 [Neurospora crassa]
MMYANAGPYSVLVLKVWGDWGNWGSAPVADHGSWIAEDGEEWGSSTRETQSRRRAG